MPTVLSEADVRSVLELAELLPVVRAALIKQTDGAVERPERPHFPVGAGLEGDDNDSDGDGETGTAITMPAYIHGSPYFATKLVSLSEGNAERGLPTLHAQVVLTDAETGEPAALLGATTITNARTGCIGGLAVAEFAPDARSLGVVGAGAQARWQTRAIDAVSALEAVRIYSPSDSRQACAADLADRGIPARAVDSPRAAVVDADVVVTATTSSTPVFPADAIDAPLVVAVGAFTPDGQELEPAVIEGATAVYADVPAEVATIGDLQATTLSVGDLRPLGEALARPQRAEPHSAHEGRVVVESVGSAVLDAAAARLVYERATDGDAGIGSQAPLD